MRKQKQLFTRVYSSQINSGYDDFAHWDNTERTTLFLYVWQMLSTVLACIGAKYEQTLILIFNLPQDSLNLSYVKYVE